MQHYDTRIVVLQEIHLYLTVETADNKTSAFSCVGLKWYASLFIELICCI